MEFIEPALTAQADAAAVLMSVRTTPSTNCRGERVKDSLALSS